VEDLAGGDACTDARLVAQHVGRIGGVHDQVVFIDAGLAHDALQCLDVDVLGSVRAGKDGTFAAGQAVLLVQLHRDGGQGLHRLGSRAVKDLLLHIAGTPDDVGVLVDDADVAVVGVLQQAAAVFLDQFCISIHDDFNSVF